LERALSDFGCERSFVKAVGGLEEHYGFTVPASAAARITHKCAAAIVSMPKDQTMSLPQKGSDWLIAEADGSMVPIARHDGKHSDVRKNRTVEYREARLCVCQNPKQLNAWYEASFEEVEKIGQSWAKCAKKAGRGLNTKIHVVSDGAPWIHSQAQIYLQPQRYLVDYFHVCEYLASAKISCSENDRWMNTQKKRLKTNHPERVIKTLKAYLEPITVTEPDAPVRKAHRYLSNRIDQLDYAGAIKATLPIGSGLIESGHKHVIQARMKIAGAAWQYDNAENLLAARALRANGKWADFWNN